MQTSQILERIAQLRRDRNWTEYRLSIESKIPQTTISSWYKKKLCPSILSLSKIWRGFRYQYGSIFFRIRPISRPHLPAGKTPS